ncbi:MAG: hypothetical protein R3Y12_07785 [Clostridia bacterium]
MINSTSNKLEAYKSAYNHENDLQTMQSNEFLGLKVGQALEKQESKSSTDDSQQDKNKAYTDDLNKKLLAGKTLTNYELDHIQNNSPHLSKEAEEIEKERKEYAETLDTLISVDSVEEFKALTLAKYYSQTEAISDNSNLSDAQKKTLTDAVVKKIAGVMDEHNKYEQKTGIKQFGTTIKSSEPITRRWYMNT